MRQRFKLKHVNEITGTFVILVVIVVIAAVIGMAFSQRWFQRTVPVDIRMPPEGAAGIRRGADVYFLGTNVGTVSDVVLLPPKGQMVAYADIRNDFFLYLRTGSFAVVKKTLGVAGNSYFDISRGEGTPLPWGATIDCKQLAPSLDATVNEIRKAALPALKRLGTAVDTYTALGAHLDETREQVSQILARVDILLAAIEQGKGTAGEVLTDPAIANDVRSVLDKANASMEQLQGILKNIEAASANVSSISETIAGETKNLPSVVLQLQQTLQDLDRLIRGVEEVWPIRSHVEQPQSDTRISPSEVTP